MKVVYKTKFLTIHFQTRAATSHRKLLSVFHRGHLGHDRRPRREWSACRARLKFSGPLWGAAGQGETVSSVRRGGGGVEVCETGHGELAGNPPRCVL